MTSRRIARWDSYPSFGQLSQGLAQCAHSRHYGRQPQPAGTRPYRIGQGRSVRSSASPTLLTARSHAEMRISSARISMHCLAYSLTVHPTLSAIARSLFHRSGRKSDRRLGAAEGCGDRASHPHAYQPVRVPVDVVLTASPDPVNGRRSPGLLEVKKTVARA